MGLPEPVVQLGSALLSSLETNEAVRRLEKNVADLLDRMEQNRPEFMDYKAAAAYLRLSVTTLQQAVSGDTIPHYKIGAAVRFSRAELDDWMMSKRIDKGERSARKAGRAKRQGRVGVPVV